MTTTASPTKITRHVPTCPGSCRGGGSPGPISSINPLAGAALTATGHIVGATYFSDHYQMHYFVESEGTIWDLAPGRAVAVVWENGNRTLTARPRGADRLCPGR